MQRLHAALSAIDAATANTADPAQLLIAAKCRGLIQGYHSRWQNQPYAAEGVEHLVTNDLWNPETGRKSRSFTVASKLDVTAIYNGRRVIFDHKTTSEDIADQNSPYWRQLAIEGQVSHYMLAEWLNGRKVDEACWDVVKKPGISPKNVTKADVKQALASGEYFGVELSAWSLEQLKASGRETLEMYTARLAYDCTTERPQWYFQRRTVPRLDADLHEYATELWEHGQEILHARNTNRWARNSGACMPYNSPCKFLGICSGHDTADSEKWRRKECVHVELAGLVEGDGRDVLTNSRVRVFQTCRRKHYLQYELGIEQVDEEEREALYFGNLWHAAQEAWWNGTKQERNEETNGYSNDFTVPVTAAGIGSNDEAPEYF